MVIFTIIAVLICRDRHTRHHLEELTIANMSGALPLGDWSAASRSRYSGPRPPPTVGHYMEDDFNDDEEDYYYGSGYPPLPRHGRSRFNPRRMMRGTRSVVGRFSRPASALEEEDHEIEALVAQHFRQQKRQQQHHHARKDFPCGYDDDDMQAEEVVKLPSTRKTVEEVLPPHEEKPLQIKKDHIWDVIHLEDATSVSSRPSKRTGSW